MATESLPCKLNDAEVMDRTRKLMDALDLEDQLDQKLATFKEQHKREASAAEYETRKLRMIVGARTEYRDIEIAESHDYKRAIVEVLRADTQEIVRTRAMTKEERQSPLFEDRTRA